MKNLHLHPRDRSITRRHDLTNFFKLATEAVFSRYRRKMAKLAALVGYSVAKFTQFNFQLPTSAVVVLSF